MLHMARSRPCAACRLPCKGQDRYGHRPQRCRQQTTLLGAIMGCCRQGARFVLPVAHRRSRYQALVRRGISLVPEKRELFADMTVQENLELGGFSRRRCR